MAEIWTLCIYNTGLNSDFQMDPLLINGEKPLQHVSTLVRQLVFDVIFVVENIVLITIALNSNVRELQENQVRILSILQVIVTLF